MMRFTVFPRRGLRGRRWYFRIVAANGEPIAQSEGYRNKADCIYATGLIRRGAPYALVEVLDPKKEG